MNKSTPYFVATRNIDLTSKNVSAFQVFQTLDEALDYIMLVIESDSYSETISIQKDDYGLRTIDRIDKEYRTYAQVWPIFKAEYHDEEEWESMLFEVAPLFINEIYSLNN